MNRLVGSWGYYGAGEPAETLIYTNCSESDVIQSLLRRARNSPIIWVSVKAEK
jgi:hypothetical protein